MSICRVCGQALTEENHAKKQGNLCKKCYNKNMWNYYHVGNRAVTDCLDKDKPVSFKEILEKSGAGCLYARRILNQMVKLGIVEYLEGDCYRVNPKNPLRYALDGYYKEKVVVI